MQFKKMIIGVVKIERAAFAGDTLAALAHIEAERAHALKERRIIRLGDF